MIEKISQRIEKIPDDPPKEDFRYLADPRLFKISPNNVRKSKIEEGLDRLKRSVESEGFNEPVFSNMDFKIVAGGSRWRLASNEGWKLPVIFKKFNSDVDEIIFSILENDPEPLQINDLAEAFLVMGRKGMDINDITKRLGRTEDYIRGVTSSAFIPKEMQEIPNIAEVSPAKVKTIQDYGKEQNLTDEQVGQLVGDLKDKSIGEIKKTLSKKKTDTDTVLTVRIPNTIFIEWTKKCSRLGWDIQKTIRTLLNMWVGDKIEIKGEEYTNEGIKKGT